MAEREALTAEFVRQILDYNPETGEFHWKARPCEHFKTINAYGMWNARFPGKVAGSDNGCGYLKIGINARLYKAHRLAWLYMTGEWPVKEIDHINLNKSDNRFANLREATNAQNSYNRPIRKTNSCGIKGVCLDKRYKKWRAKITHNGTTRFLGHFYTKEDAAAAYAKAAHELHGEFARVK